MLNENTGDHTKEIGASNPTEGQSHALLRYLGCLNPDTEFSLDK